MELTPVRRTSEMRGEAPERISGWRRNATADGRAARSRPSSRPAARSWCATATRASARWPRDLDLTESVLRDWVRQADVDDGRRDGLTIDEKAELAGLRREKKVLREEREILKKGRGFLRQGDPVSRSRFIEAEKAGHPVTTMCRVLEGLRSASYDWAAGPRTGPSTTLGSRT